MKEWGIGLRRTALLALGVVFLSGSVNLTVLATDLPDKPGQSDTSDTTTPGTSDTANPSDTTDTTGKTDSTDPSGTTNPSDTTDTTDTSNKSDASDINNDSDTPDDSNPGDNSNESGESNKSDASNEANSPNSNTGEGEGNSSKGTTTIRSFDPLPSNISFQTLAEGSNPQLPTTLSMQAVTVKPHEVSGTFAATKAIFSVAKTYNTDPSGAEISGWEWKIDTSGDKSTYGTFRSESGTRYTFVATPPATDAEGNILVVPTGLQLPSITVQVVGSAPRKAARANASAPADAGTPAPQAAGDPNWGSGAAEFGGVKVVGETGTKYEQVDEHIELKSSGNYYIEGTWAKPDTLKGSTNPLLQLTGEEGNGEYDIELRGLNIDISDATFRSIFSIGNNVKKVTIRTPGGALTTLKVSDSNEINSGRSIVTIPNGCIFHIYNGTLSLTGEMVNENGGTLNVEGTTISGQAPIYNKGSMTITFDTTAQASPSSVRTGSFINEGTVTVSDKSSLTVVGNYSNRKELKLATGANIVVEKTKVPVKDPNTGGVVDVDNAFTNSGNGIVSVGDGCKLDVRTEFTNEGIVELAERTDSGFTGPELFVADTFNNTGTLILNKKNEALFGAAFDNDGKLTLADEAKMTVNGTFTNRQEDLTIVNGSTLTLGGAVNEGTIIIQDLGTLSGTGSTTFTNNGVLKTAARDRLQKITFASGSSGEFYLTGMETDIIIVPDKLAYDGEDHYSELLKGGYKEEIEDTVLNATFTVKLDPGWNPDVYKDNGGSVIEKTSEVKWSGDYYVGYTKGNNVGPIFSKIIHMDPASLMIDTGAPAIPEGHPYLDSLPEDQKEGAKAYEHGSTINIGINMAIESRGKKGTEGIGHDLKVTVTQVSDESGAPVTGQQPVIKDTNSSSKPLLTSPVDYTVEFKKSGAITTVKITIPTTSGDGYLPLGKYKVSVNYVEADTANAPTGEEQVLLTKEADILIIRGKLNVDLGNFSGTYTYGDEIKEPIENRDFTVGFGESNRGGTGHGSITYEWYKAESIEAVEGGVGTLVSRGTEGQGDFPSWQDVKSSIGGEDATGNYVLKIIVDQSPYSTEGIGYKLINIGKKDLTLKVKGNPHKIYGTADADAEEPMELDEESMTDLVEGDTLGGDLGRERDKDNTVNGGKDPGDDRFDKVGTYTINPGNVANPNYNISFDKEYKFEILPKQLSWNTTDIIVADKDGKYSVYGGLKLHGLLDEDKGRVVATYGGMSLSEDGEKLIVSNTRLLNVNEAGSDYASNYASPVTPEDGIKLTSTAYSLFVTEDNIVHQPKALEGKETTLSMKNRVISSVKDLRAEQLGNRSEENYKVFDVEVRDKDGVTVEAFDKSGLILTLPYPEGTSKNNRFVAVHMITSDIEGKDYSGGKLDPGNIEQFVPSSPNANGGTLSVLEQTDAGITIKVTGLSPVAIAWAPANSTNPGTDDPNNPNNPNDPNNPDDPNNPNNPNNPDDPSNPNNPNNPNNSGNTNNGDTNNGDTNNGNTNNTDTNKTDTNKSDDNKTDTNKTGTTSTTKTPTTSTTATTKKNTSTTTRATGAQTGDTAQIAFYAGAAAIALVLLILIICLIRAQFKRKD